MTDAAYTAYSYVGHGYDDDTIRAGLGGNVYRVLQSIWVP
jgi:hypothetical protein